MTTLARHAEFYRCLRVVGAVLGVDRCWYYGGDFHFILAGDWTVSISPETAGRVRVTTWHRLRERDRKWAALDDVDRVAQLVGGARETALQPV